MKTMPKFSDGNGYAFKMKYLLHASKHYFACEIGL